MGILQRLFKPRPRPEPPFTAGNPLAPLAGTTTSRADDARAVMERYGQAAHGFLETTGSLVREFSDERQEESVGVAVDGTTIGYLWTVNNDSLARESFERPLPVQMFCETVDDAVRVEAWAWLAPTAPAWNWSSQNRPPMTTEGKGAQRAADTQRMLREQAAGSPARAREISRGTVDGVHYLELVEPIKQAKREGRNEDALTLCYQAIQGAENDRPRDEDRFDGYDDLVKRGIIEPRAADEGWVPAPGYTKHAAIILRKLKRADEEIAVLERYLQWVPDDTRAQHEFTERIAKVRGLQQRTQG